MKTVATTGAHEAMTIDRAVWVDPGRMSGAPCFRGSRLPVQQLFDWLADGVSLDEFVEEFEIDRDRGLCRPDGCRKYVLCPNRLQDQANPAHLILNRS